MFSKLGFFRFVANYNKPIESLESAIKAHCDVSDSLIVLPEAFNISKYYRDAGDCDYSRDILDQLRAVAGKGDVTLVAGLIVEEPDGPTPPYSSAYLIDGSGAAVICRKHGADFSGAPPLTPENGRTHWNVPISERIRFSNYTPCEAASNTANPLKHQGASIAAIICMDCDLPYVFRPIEERFSMMAGPKIVCIPACMNSVYLDDAIAATWPEQYVILANSDSHGCRSFISKEGTIMMRDNHESENTIVLCAP
jgi:predicted amidohydrolase